MSNEQSRVLDAAVAERIMGWHRDTSRPQSPCWVTSDGQPFSGSWSDAFVDCWKPSERIEQAWQVVEEMQRRYGFGSKNGFTLMRREGEAWYCEFPRPRWECAEADTAPEAMCRAVLSALGEE